MRLYEAARTYTGPGRIAAGVGQAVRLILRHGDRQLRVHSYSQRERLFLDVDLAGNRIDRHRSGRALSIICTNGHSRLALGYARDQTRFIHGENIRIAAGEAAVSAVARREDGADLNALTDHDGSLRGIGLHLGGRIQNVDLASHIRTIRRAHGDGCAALRNAGHNAVCVHLRNARIGGFVGDRAGRSIGLYRQIVAEVHLQLYAVLYANRGTGAAQARSHGFGQRAFVRHRIGFLNRCALRVGARFITRCTGVRLVPICTGVRLVPICTDFHVVARHTGVCFGHSRITGFGGCVCRCIVRAVFCLRVDAGNHLQRILRLVLIEAQLRGFRTGLHVALQLILGLNGAQIRCAHPAQIDGRIAAGIEGDAETIRLRTGPFDGVDDALTDARLFLFAALLRVHDRIVTHDFDKAAGKCRTLARARIISNRRRCIRTVGSTIFRLAALRLGFSRPGVHIRRAVPRLRGSVAGVIRRAVPSLRGSVAGVIRRAVPCFRGSVTGVIRRAVPGF